MVILGKLLDPNEREVKRHLAVAQAINALEPELEKLDDAGLKARSDDLRKRGQDGEDLDDLLIEAFALCRDQKLPIRVFSIIKPGALKRVVMGEDEGTLVYA